MTKLIVLAIAIFSVYVFINNDNARNEVIKEIEKISNSDAGGGTSETSDKKDLSKYTQEEIEYFNEIALKSEYSNDNNGQPSKWKSDVNIFVQGQKTPELMAELERIVSELNSIIDPININVVNDKSDANLIMLFDSQYEYHKLAPLSKEYTEDNWGMFIINSGKDIYRGTMYIDVVRCTDLQGQKHLLREELTQSLGLKNDSYKYENSIFQQRWTEVTEYAPIDIKVIEMLYNN